MRMMGGGWRVGGHVELADVVEDGVGKDEDGEDGVDGEQKESESERRVVVGHVLPVSSPFWVTDWDSECTFSFPSHQAASKHSVSVSGLFLTLVRSRA